MKLRAPLTLPFVTSLLVACGGTAHTDRDPTAFGGSGGEAATGVVAGRESGGGGGDVGTSGSGGTTAGGTSGGGTSGGGAGNGGHAGEAYQLVELGPGSWDMKGTATVIPGANNVIPIHLQCSSVDFALNVTQVDSGYRLTVGRNGQMDGASAQLAIGSYSVPTHLTLPTGSACQANRLEVEGLTLRGLDLNNDGKADQLAGSVTAQATFIQGDVGATDTVQIELVGTPDTSEPTLHVPETFNPLLPPLFSASEPLSIESSLTLLGTTTLPLTALPADAVNEDLPLKAVINFGTDTILPLSGSWSVAGPAPDLAGHPLASSGMLNTLADPGVFLQDGFEGPLLAAIETPGASLVTGVGTIPAISGTQSLWVLPSSAVTFHLKRAANEQSVRLSLRSFSTQGSAGALTILAGVVGGSRIAPASYSPPASQVDTGDTTWPKATPISQLTVPITDPGTDVLVRVTSPQCYGFCPPQSALLVDDLRLE